MAVSTSFALGLGNNKSVLLNGIRTLSERILELSFLSLIWFSLMFSCPLAPNINRQSINVIYMTFTSCIN